MLVWIGEQPIYIREMISQQSQTTASLSLTVHTSLAFDAPVALPAACFCTSTAAAADEAKRLRKAVAIFIVLDCAQFRRCL